MSYARLHLDAKTVIAQTSIAAWNALMRADPEFGRYALSEMGRSMFLTAFTVIEDGEWRVDGKLHRVGGPARVFADGDERWYERGRLHRIDGPAVTRANGGEEWYERGRSHRAGGQPAVTRPDGSIEWCEHGLWHRIVSDTSGIPGLGGPARIFANGYMEWWERGIMIQTAERDGPILAATPVKSTTRYRRRGSKKHTIAHA